jgi:hypothetical protein
MTTQTPRHVAGESTGATRAADVASVPVGGDAPEWEPMPPASQPTRSGPVGIVGPILAVLLIALGVVLLRDALVAAGVLAGAAWIPAALGPLDGVRPGPSFLIGGIVAALLGLWLIFTAVRPRVRSGVKVASRTGIFLGTGDVARLASAAAEDVGGVISASTVATRRKVSTTVRTTGGPGIAAAVRDAVTDRLTDLEPPARVTVTVRGGNSGGRTAS